MKMGSGCGAEDYVTRVITDPGELDGRLWDALLDAHPDGGTGGAHGPFMRHAYLLGLHRSGSATPDNGWSPHWVTLWRDNTLQAATPLYHKTHSYGEYVFDWAWADAYHRHGLAYYPKGLVAVPFTPVPGPRLLAVDGAARQALVRALLDHASAHGLSSLHVLMASPTDQAACVDAGLMERQTVQFHWHNTGVGAAALPDFEAFLATLTQEKRKKIRQERRKVAAAGLQFEARRGAAITPEDWAFMVRCYTQTYHEHGNPPYLQPAFFMETLAAQQGLWVLFLARNGAGERVACSLVALSDTGAHPTAAYGRYWGALQRVDCLHFEACYHQPLDWCIANGVQRFEGGAQGEHKMARALMPTATHSAHWLAHPAFAEAVQRFLEREGAGVEGYMAHLATRSPLKTA